MRKTVAGIVLGVWVAAAGCGRKEAASGGGITPVADGAPARGSLPGGCRRICGDDLRDLAFVRADGRAIGFAVGAANTLLRSADDGATWTRVFPRDAKAGGFENVQFASAAEGWVVGRDLLLHTADTGLTWTAAARPPGNFYYFGAGSATTSAWFQIQPPTCGATVFRTSDGGRTWTALPATLPRNDFHAICFVDDRTGWLGGVDGRLARTRDGGATWETLRAPGSTDFTRLFFATAERGWTAPYHRHGGGPSFTADGGVTWTRADCGIPDSQNIADLQMLDANRGFAVWSLGADGTKVLHTVDGGATWGVVAAGPEGMEAVAFVDEHTGWLAGSGGRIMDLRR